MYLQPFTQLYPRNGLNSAQQNSWTLSTIYQKGKTLSVVSTRKSSSDSIETKGKFKTELCRYYSLQLECPFSELCCFAHGQEELRSKETLPLKYKTKQCVKFCQEGFCPYGQRCQFIHSHGHHIISYSQIVDKIRSDSELFFEYFLSEPSGKHRRFSLFKEIQVKSENSQDFNDGLGHRQTRYGLVEERTGHRTRHNSI